MSTDASAPVPRASILANESLVWDASAAWPLDPTQIAPESLTIGINAAANPPATGSSDFARATRFEMTTTLTGILRFVLHQPEREPLVPLRLLCGEDR
jgi:hypothetical protein